MIDAVIWEAWTDRSGPYAICIKDDSAATFHETPGVLVSDVLGGDGPTDPDIIFPAGTVPAVWTD